MPGKIPLPDFGPYTDEDMAALIAAAVEESSQNALALAAQKMEDGTLAEVADIFTQEIGTRERT